MFSLLQNEWWFCNNQDCGGADRVFGLEGQVLAQWWLQELRNDPIRKDVVRHLVRSDIPLTLFRVADPGLVQRVEELLISGQLHFHKKKREVHSGAEVQENNVPFPISNRQTRDASPPPPVLDPPSFPPDVDLSAQAAALVAAAAQGTPFCAE